MSIRVEHTPARPRARAFSFIELLILVVAALVVAGLSVPVLRGITLATNSESATETLVRVRDFQIRFHEKGIATSAAGAPRFGTWNELLRSGLNIEDAGLRDSGALLALHGYVFQTYFAARAGDPVVNPADVGADNAKDRFVIYAWPQDYGRSGASVFAIDPSGMLRVPAPAGILESKNLLNRYSGSQNVPKWAAARSESASRAKPAASAPANAGGLVRGEDGELWEVIPFPNQQ